MTHGSEPTNFGVYTDGQTPIASGANSGGWRTYTKFSITFFAPDALLVWTNHPNPVTELFGNTLNRAGADLTYVTQYRIWINVGTIANAGAEIGLQYSIDAGVTWRGIATGADGDQILGNGTDFATTGLQNSGWSDLWTGANSSQAEVLLRIVGDDGNGAIDPTLGTIIVEFR